MDAKSNLRTLLAHGARERLSRLCHELQVPNAPCREDVREVILVMSSSRGGSTVFADLLRCSPELLSFRAEINPFLRLNHLDFPESGSRSDALDETHATRLGDWVSVCLSDIGWPVQGLPDRESEQRFALELYARLVLQWPAVEMNVGRVLDWVSSTLAELRAGHGWVPDEFPDAHRFHALFLSKVRSVHPEVNPYYYDIKPSLIRRYSPDARPPEGPPGEVILEEPPFITIGPWSRPTELDRPLIIKTPSNAYRLPFFRALFPEARLRVLHLTRNPAACVSGLYDGWLHHGFFSHEVDQALHIAGYSDLYPAWGRSWWKFDLPPGWESWTERSLLAVCGWQWRSPHDATLDYVEANCLDYLAVRFEDLISPDPLRSRTVARLAEWLNVRPDSLFQALEHGLPHTMCTQKPRPRRWLERAEMLEPVLRDAPIRHTVERLGYEANRKSWL